MPNPTILALDFDGVICDGLIEYFQTTWRAYVQIWHPTNKTVPDHLASPFYRLRPVIETGWEMPVLLHALIQGVPEAEILAQWSALVQRYQAEYQLDAKQVAQQVDGVRDAWIAEDLEYWLAQHRFYPGVIDRLKGIIEASQTQSSPVGTYPVIVTTKEGRFARQLLQQQGVELADSQIIGKEIRQPKYKTLRQLIQRFSDRTDGPVTLWFIEDRLKTLQLVQQQPDLASVRLFLADWGYNTAAAKETANRDAHIRLLSLDQFAQDFSAWG